MRRAVLSAWVLVWSVFPATVRGQSVVRGSVRADSSVRVLSGVEVSVEGPVSRTRKTDVSGIFQLEGLPAGQLVLWFRRAGYRPVRAVAELSGQDTLELDVQLVPVAQELRPLSVTARTPPARRQQNLISAQEIESVLGVAQDAHELIRKLRPSYLRGRGGATLGDPNAMPADLVGDTTKAEGPEAIARAQRIAAARAPRPHLPKVSVDEGALQELDALRQIPASTIREIRLMSAIDAAIRFGTGVEGGVILVMLKQ